VWPVAGFDASAKGKTARGGAASCGPRRSVGRSCPYSSVAWQQQTIQERRNQFHTARAGEFLDPFNPDVSSFLEQTRAIFYQQTGDPAGSQQRALKVLADLRQQQAASFAFFDVF
jgi:hypothetical protein